MFKENGHITLRGKTYAKLRYEQNHLCNRHEKMTYIITLCRATEFSTILVYLAAKMFGLNKNPEGEIDEERIDSVMLDKNENNLTELIEKIEVFCEKFEASARQNYYVTMVVEEICTAIMENAFTDKHKNMYILVTIIAEPEGDFRLCIRDNALAIRV